MPIHRLAAGLIAAALLAGCGTSQVERRFQVGDFPEVVRLFEADSALFNDADALFRAGVAYALPESSVHDAERAARIFDRLLVLDPVHPQRMHVEHMQQFLRATLENRQSGEEALRELTARVDEQRRQLTALEEQLTRERARADAARTSVERLDREIRERESRIQALEAELAALKQIDLNRPPSTTRRTPPPAPRN